MCSNFVVIITAQEMVIKGVCSNQEWIQHELGGGALPFQLNIEYFNCVVTCVTSASKYWSSFCMINA